MLYTAHNHPMILYLSGISDLSCFEAQACLDAPTSLLQGLSRGTTNNPISWAKDRDVLKPLIYFIINIIFVIMIYEDIMLSMEEFSICNIPKHKCHQTDSFLLLFSQDPEIQLFPFPPIPPLQPISSSITISY